MIVDGKLEARAVEETFDYVIVGSGAAGATAARVLADTGASIGVVEEGPAYDPALFGDRMYPALRDMFRDMGTQIARGRTFIPVLQGRGLGGSTVVNSAIVWRIPDDVWEPWDRVFGLGDTLPLGELHEQWDQIESEIAVARTPPEVWGRNNSVVDDAVAGLGLSGAATRRNVHNCRGSSRCQLGCPYNAKQSMLITYLPYAEERGATVFVNAPVRRVVRRGDRAVGVTGHFHSTDRKKRGPRFELRARKAVIVACSAIQTPGLLHRSGVRSRHLGAHFQAHPGVPVVGVFDDKIDVWTGATQGYDVDEHRRDWRFKIESLSLPPEMIFARLPGVGTSWLDNIAASGHMTSWAVQMRATAEGSIHDHFFGTDIRFSLNELDMTNIRRGIRF
ncbi:MAG TPA: GMC family oxidoreductase N-terminal domain-containing protein, partial [Actinomycetota bacterium]|nr:GMC family oxidoreductase N-terminal domain-containing protein [Actinomycetota bacterium]